MEIICLSNLLQIDVQSWNELVDPDYPFFRHEFLSALERSGCVCINTGWQTRHLLVKDQDRLLAILPVYLKYHSWGEYVFDQSWAQAYQMQGMDYYPKALTAIPFTPCQGPRLLLKSGQALEPILDLLLASLQKHSEFKQISSWHCLFPEPILAQSLRQKGLFLRHDVQFHWFNRNYSVFEDFLRELNSGKRKMIKRERRKIIEQGICLKRFVGTEISPEDWEAFYRFYALTYQKRRSQPYLNPAFFQLLADRMPENLLLIMAYHRDEPVAAALCFIGTKTLYGRYWGCGQDYDALHFETCYYQGIEYCIQQGLQHFDSGAQGEHKIARGFEPITTCSAHWIRDARFSKTIADFVELERQHINSYKNEAASYLPFRQMTES